MNGCPGGERQPARPGESATELGRLIADFHEGPQETVYLDYRGLRLTSAYQPIYGLASGRLVGQEALLRCDTEGVSPDVIFRLAERYGETLDLDDLTQILHMYNFARLGAPESWLFLNSTPRSLCDPARAAVIGAALQDFGLPAERLVIEILESEVDDVDALTRGLAPFREMGARVAVDDFGVGHSNLDRVWALAPDLVKLDRSLLPDRMLAEHGDLLLRGLVSTFHTAGMLTVMEGVETHADLAVAVATGIDFTQGYYLHVPRTGGLVADDGSKLPGLLSRLQLAATESALQQRDWLQPYLRHFARARQALESGFAFPGVASSIVRQTGAVTCVLLNGEGGLVAAWPPDSAPGAIRDQHGIRAHRGRRGYFYRALAHTRNIQISRPYRLPLHASPVVTLAASVERTNRVEVLCCDLPHLPPVGAQASGEIT